MNHAIAENSETEYSIFRSVECSWQQAEFIGATVHASNNFLSSLRGFAELAKMSLADPDEVSSYLDEIILANKRAEIFNAELLAMAGCSPVSAHWIDAESFALSVKKNTDDLLPMSTWPDAGLELYLDSKWSGRALAAFAELARYLGAKTSLRLIHDSGWIALVIETATPIEGVQPQRLFEPFYYTRALRSEQGLGLAWLPGLQRKLGGDVRIALANSGAFALQLCWKMRLVQDLKPAP